MKPQIVSVLMVVPVCFLSCLCSTTMLDLWNYCKGNSGSPNVHTPRLASHTSCQHLSDGFRRPESVEMWFSYRSLLSLLFLLFPRGPEHIIQLDSLGFSWYECVSGICLEEEQLEGRQQMLVDSPSAGLSPCNWPEMQVLERNGQKRSVIS